MVEILFGSFSCSSLQNNWKNHCQSENSRGGNCLLLPHAGYAYDDKEIVGTTTAKWLLNRHAILDEYMQKSWLVPPLVILSHVAVFFLYVCTKCDCSTVEPLYKKDFKNIQLESLNKKLDSTEKSAVDAHWLETEFKTGNQAMVSAVETMVKVKDDILGKLQKHLQGKNDTVRNQALPIKNSRKRKKRGIEDSDETMQIEVSPDQVFMQLNNENRRMFDDIREELKTRFEKLEVENQKLMNAIADLKTMLQK